MLPFDGQGVFELLVSLGRALQFAGLPLDPADLGVVELQPKKSPDGEADQGDVRAVFPEGQEDRHGYTLRSNST